VLGISGTEIAGMVWPDGTDTILILERTGLGTDGDGTPACYGPGTDIIEEAGRTASSTPNTCDGVVVEGTKLCCYDPVIKAIGSHNYPYATVLIFYDANDLLAVKNGTKEYWEVVPYHTELLNLNFFIQPGDVGGIAYDTASQNLFISQRYTDTLADTNNPNPIIHVFHLTLNPGKRYRYLSIASE